MYGEEVMVGWRRSWRRRDLEAIARGKWGHNGRGKWCSYKKTTLIVCSVNIIVALYVFRSLYNSLYMYPISDSQSTFAYSEDQISEMEESNRIRKISEPTELIKLVSQLKTRIIKEASVEQLSQPLKQKFIDEILDRLRSLTVPANATVERDGMLFRELPFGDVGLSICTKTIEIWRKEKLEEAKLVVLGETLNSTILPEEAAAVAKALSSEWSELLEDIGLWFPTEVVNKEHDDKPENEEDFDSRILPGRRLPPVCHSELHTDYDGVAVRWGLTHRKDSAYECCMACLDQAKRVKPGENKCNIWVYCPSETGCHSPDIYEHKNQECWLKYSEEPKLNFKDRYPESYREAHPDAPLVVPWVSGVVSI